MLLCPRDIYFVPNELDGNYLTSDEVFDDEMIKETEDDE